jgi:GcrA cell cycle regulator
MPASPLLLWWTEQRIEELKSRWRNNESAGEIANAMHASSRNAVIGKAHRLGLLKKRATTVKRASPAPRQRYNGVISVKAKTEVRMIAPPPETAKSFAELEPRDCRWPLDLSFAEPARLFCAAPAAPDFPYCAYHCRLAYTPGAFKVRRP